MGNIYDIVIIGSGGTGCAAALEASSKTQNILIVTKGDFFHSKTARAQGGIQASFSSNDSAEIHYNDTMEAGKHCSDPKMVEVMTNSACDTVRWLEGYGVNFDKINGEYVLSSAAGLTHPRVLTCSGQAGERILRPLAHHVKSLGIDIFEYHGVTDISNENNQFRLQLKNKKNEIITVKSKALILASGGVLQKEVEIGMQKNEIQSSLNTLKIAKKLNLNIVNTDLVQYHPTGVVSPSSLRRERLPETMRGDGATLVNSCGEEFSNPLATRGKLTEAIINECKEDRCISTEDGYRGVLMQTQNIDHFHGLGYLANKYPKFYKHFLDHGIDISKEPVLVYPILHYSLGGIKSDEKAQTNLNGCFVAGEASWGVHGNDRLMGNSLLEIFVFGRIAGQEACKYIYLDHK
tara:strand:+ start:14419 stop:15636 length:1218 start_codon:yes stop_codon:yes gene_type:complete